MCVGGRNVSERECEPRLSTHPSQHATEKLSLHLNVLKPHLQYKRLAYTVLITFYASNTVCSYKALSKLQVLYGMKLPILNVSLVLLCML